MDEELRRERDRLAGEVDAVAASQECERGGMVLAVPEREDDLVVAAASAFRQVEEPQPLQDHSGWRLDLCDQLVVDEGVDVAVAYEVGQRSIAVVGDAGA